MSIELISVLPADATPRPDATFIEIEPAPMEDADRRVHARSAVIAVVMLGIGFATGLGVAGRTPPAPPAAAVGVPDVAHRTLADALSALHAAGAKVGTIRFAADVVSDSVVFQSVPAGSAVRGEPVDLVLAEDMRTPPRLLSPADGAKVPASAVSVASVVVPVGDATAAPVDTAPPVLTWTDGGVPVGRWLVTLQWWFCGPAGDCGWLPIAGAILDTPGWSPVLGAEGQVGPMTLRWRVSNIDDFGTVAGTSDWRRFTTG